MKRLLLLITICISSVSYGQFNCADTTLVELTYFNSWSIVDITSPILFTDSGGENGEYSSNEDYEIIFNSGSSTNTIVVNINETGFEHSTFTAFDILKIYTSTDGVNWISYEDPNFFYHDYSIVPDNIGNGIIPFTLDLGTQYVKFTFYSDPSITKPGWKIILTPQNSSTSPGSETMTECNSYTWNTNGQTYTQSGQYTTVLTNAQGCDSTVTLDLTITQPNTGSETMTECNSYTWNTNGQTYTQTGQYTTVLTNAQGCDSTVTLDLTITNSNTGTDIQTACDSYTWLDGTTYTSSNNSATWILTNASGCDSTVTLDLTINSSSSSTQTQTGIDSYTWSVNNETYTESGAYTAVIPNAAGCDSTITLDLTLEFVGLNENESYYVAVYPNPTYSSFILTTKDMIHMNYTLVDIQGKVVLTGKIESSEETVDISNLSRGRYNLVFEGESIPVVSVIKQ
ncbi:MAG: T9SS type A sorting domain-containing protein [Flavobacteriaceae bacterium]|nr:T9SS type A sorting domain-containing protein [Flavobacteriaceae bacterium]